MESNIKWLVAAGHEMASELKAECGAVDMRSVAKLISDLATQLEVQLSRIALASLEAEPVGAFHIAEQQVDGTSDYLKDGEWPIDNGIIEVYAAPPAPVVPDDWQLVPKKITLEMECALSKADSYEIGWLWALAGRT